MIANHLLAACLVVMATGAASAEPARTATITQVGREAVCRNAQGAKIAPTLQPPVPTPASIEADARARVLVGAVDCFLNPSEFTLDTAGAERCSSARIAGPSPRIAGTRSISAPHCDN